MLYIFKYILYQLTLRTDGILFPDEPGVVAGLGVAGDGAFFVFNSPISLDITSICCTTPLIESAFACTASVSLSNLISVSDFEDCGICFGRP